MSDKDTMLAAEKEASPDLTQIAIRIPTDLYKTVAKTAIDRDTSAQQMWIDAMRAFLKRKVA